MLLKYKDAEYNNKIEHLRNNGYTVNNVALDYEDFITDVESQTLFAEFQLPNGGKSYKDYSAIVAWSDYLENDNPNEERTHSGMPVPITFTADNNGNPVICSYVFEDTATEGIVRLIIAVTGTTEHTDADFKDYIDNLGGLMFIEGDECTLDPDVSLVVPNLEAFFAQVNETQTFQLDLTTKTKLLSLGDDESCCFDSSYKCYKIVSRKPSVKTSEVLFDGTYYFTENSSYQLSELPRGTVINLTGYTAEELAVTVKKTIYETAKTNSQIFKTTVTNYSPGCLYLNKDLIYPISESLFLSSNLRIEGNGSTIMAYAANEDSEGNFVERKNMAIITNKDLTTPISNVSFSNLTFKGTYPLCDTNNQPISDGETSFIGDQCVYTQAEHPLIKNLSFENVNFTGFKFAVHTGKDQNAVYNAENCNWKFNNCDFTDVETGFMLSWVQGITVTNCHIDNSIAKDDLHHCMYIARGSSYITVDNCLLENSIGGGIDFGDTTKATDEKKMHHCSFTNLQIRNCRIAVTIGNASEDIIVKNIFATNVGRALKLGNCKRVTIDNFNATGSFYYDFIRKDADGETCFPNANGEWSGISVWGYADAKITNSFFSTGGAMFVSAKSGLLPDELASQPVRTTLEFDNCIFVSTFSEYKLGSDGVSYYQPGASLGVNNSDLTQPYVYNVDFNNCQFYMNSENNKRSMIALYGSKGPTSLYNFYDCLIAYRDGNGNPNDDVLNYDKHGNPIVTMPNSYFISPEEGAFANIINCVFYKNRQNSSNSSNYGFIKNEYRDDNDELVAKYRIEPDVDCETFASTYIKELN